MRFRGKIALACAATLTASCARTLERHPRPVIVSATTAVGGLVFGVPLTTSCIPTHDRECDFAHDAPIVLAAALAGAVFGLWVAHEWSYGRREDRASEVEVATEPGSEPDPPQREPRDPEASRDRAFTLRGAAPAVDLPGSTLVGEGTDSSVAVACLIAKEDLVDVLEGRCLDQGYGQHFNAHDVLDTECDCPHDLETDQYRCTSLGDAMCDRDVMQIVAFGPLDAPAVSGAYAEEEARRQCWDMGGQPAPAVTRCLCDHDVDAGAPSNTCGCIADVRCQLAMP